MKIYFLIRLGVYDKGVYWIGTNQDEGVAKAEEFARHDGDNYHVWTVYEYTECEPADLERSLFNNYEDPEYKEIFSIRKGEKGERL